MTNQEIIWEHRCALADQGKLGFTGREVKVPTTDGEMILREPQEIHTYATWKQLGYQVRKGEKALAKFHIWKYAQARNQDETEDQPQGKMFMKLAFFFSPDQVEKA